MVFSKLSPFCKTVFYCRSQADSYDNKIFLREKELVQQREAMLQKHQQQNQLLDEKLQEMKNEDLQTKKKIKEASVVR